MQHSLLSQYIRAAYIQEADFHVEFGKVQRILAEINSIMAKCSPVLVIQRYIRGYLVRKIVEFQREYEEW